MLRRVSLQLRREPGVRAVHHSRKRAPRRAARSFPLTRTLASPDLSHRWNAVGNFSDDERKKVTAGEWRTQEVVQLRGLPEDRLGGGAPVDAVGFTTEEEAQQFLEEEEREMAELTKIPTMQLARDFFKDLALTADEELDAVSATALAAEDERCREPPVTDAQRREEERDVHRQFFADYYVQQGLLGPSDAQRFAFVDAMLSPPAALFWVNPEMVLSRCIVRAQLEKHVHRARADGESCPATPSIFTADPMFPTVYSVQSTPTQLFGDKLRIPYTESRLVIPQRTEDTVGLVGDSAPSSPAVLLQPMPSPPPVTDVDPDLLSDFLGSTVELEDVTKLGAPPHCQQQQQQQIHNIAADDDTAGLGVEPMPSEDIDVLLHFQAEEILAHGPIGNVCVDWSAQEEERRRQQVARSGCRSETERPEPSGGAPDDSANALNVASAAPRDGRQGLLSVGHLHWLQRQVACGALIDSDTFTLILPHLVFPFLARQQGVADQQSRPETEDRIVLEQCASSHRGHGGPMQYSKDLSLFKAALVACPVPEPEIATNDGQRCSTRYPEQTATSHPIHVSFVALHLVRKGGALVPRQNDSSRGDRGRRSATRRDVNADIQGKPEMEELPATKVSTYGADLLTVVHRPFSRTAAVPPVERKQPKATELGGTDPPTSVFIVESDWSVYEPLRRRCDVVLCNPISTRDGLRPRVLLDSNEHAEKMASANRFVHLCKELAGNFRVQRRELARALRSYAKVSSGPMGSAVASRVIYFTHSMNPIENEAVVASVLAELSVSKGFFVEGVPEDSGSPEGSPCVKLRCVPLTELCAESEELASFLRVGGSGLTTWCTVDGGLPEQEPDFSPGGIRAAVAAASWRSAPSSGYDGTFFTVIECTATSPSCRANEAEVPVASEEEGVPPAPWLDMVQLKQQFDLTVRYHRATRSWSLLQCCTARLLDMMRGVPERTTSSGSVSACGVALAFTAGEQASRCSAPDPAVVWGLNAALSGTPLAHQLSCCLRSGLAPVPVPLASLLRLLEKRALHIFQQPQDSFVGDSSSKANLLHNRLKAWYEAMTGAHTSTAESPSTSRSVRVPLFIVPDVNSVVGMALATAPSAVADEYEVSPDLLAEIMQCVVVATLKPTRKLPHHHCEPSSRHPSADSVRQEGFVITIAVGPPHQPHASLAAQRHSEAELTERTVGIRDALVYIARTLHGGTTEALLRQAFEAGVDDGTILTDAGEEIDPRSSQLAESDRDGACLGTAAARARLDDDDFEVLSERVPSNVGHQSPSILRRLLNEAEVKVHRRKLRRFKAILGGAPNGDSDVDDWTEAQQEQRRRRCRRMPSSPLR